MSELLDTREVRKKLKEGFKKLHAEEGKEEFWIDIQGRKVLIQYFAIHNKEGEYLGALEFTQNVVDIKKIEGEKRLPEWR